MNTIQSCNFRKSSAWKELTPYHNNIGAILRKATDIFYTDQVTEWSLSAV